MEIEKTTDGESIQSETKEREANTVNAGTENISVRGGFYEVDLATRSCLPVYWLGQLTKLHKILFCTLFAKIAEFLSYRNVRWRVAPLTYILYLTYYNKVHSIILYISCIE